MMEYRIEKDTMGEIKVPSDKYWGAQTQRSLENFKIGTEKMPVEVINALVVLKKAAAIANNKLGKLDSKKLKAIIEVCDEI
ncbi:MAG: lyase family protein, partial [Spirochaetaceae bacterium]|nr:lyase family protein [Spirochaetaceae bacterium]